MNTIVADDAPTPVGAYPHARREGDFIFLSGVGPRTPGTDEIPGVYFDKNGSIVDYNIELETESVIKNVGAVLQAAGSSLEEVVDVMVFLTDMKNDFETFNQVYRKHFEKIGATRTTVQVGALPTPIHVEFKVIARAK